MPTEYWLQKKAFNSWSHVTWYATEEEAKLNFNRVAVEGNGYSWRWVKVEVMGERLLHDESPVLKAEEDIEEDIKSSKPQWSNNWDSGKKPIVTNSEHGMVGKVWLGNPTTKEKKRVDPSMVDAMMKDGWVKAGPRTVL